MFEDLSDSFVRNTSGWIFGGLFVLSVFFHYQTGSKFTAACKAFLPMQELAQRVISPPNQNTTQHVANHKRLMAESSQSGAMYRQLYAADRKVEKLCSERLSR